jgi:outer membrane immunogenic protein
MRRLSITVMAAASTIAFTQIASAADMVVKALPPPPAPVYSWTGFYIGANIGGGWGDRNVNYTANDLVSLGHFISLGGAPPLASINTSGVLGGLQVGYNWANGSRVVDWRGSRHRLVRRQGVG